MRRELNTRDYTIQASLDGTSWQTIHAFKGNTENVTDVEFEAVSSQLVKMTITGPGADATASSLSDFGNLIYLVFRENGAACP